MNSATQLGLVLLAAAASAGLASLGLSATGQAQEANAIAWASWWTTLAGLAIAVAGILAGGVLGLLRERA